MLSQITWQSYWCAQAIASLIYYTGVFIYYYSNKVRTLFPKLLSRESKTPSENFSGFTLNAGEQEKDIISNGLFKVTQGLIIDLSEIVQLAARKPYLQQYLLQQLQQKLTNYSMLQGTPYEATINNFLIVETQINCSITLGEDDLKRIWTRI